MPKSKKTGYWAAWFAPNGRSRWETPRMLYYADWESKDAWDKDGNDSVALDDLGGFSDISDWGSFTFASTDKEQVSLVIESTAYVLEGIAKSWGLTVQPGHVRGSSLPEER